MDKNALMEQAFTEYRIAVGLAMWGVLETPSRAANAMYDVREAAAFHQLQRRLAAISESTLAE